MPVPCCGPVCAWCCTAFSIWGAIMLFFVGLFFHRKEVTMFDDLPMSEEELEEWAHKGYPWGEIEEKFHNQAICCWIAMGLYIVTFALSVYMISLNKKPRYNVVTKAPKIRHSAFS